MKWTREQQLENESKLAFRSLLPKEWIVREKIPDIGIDLEIEFAKGEEVENRMLLVQIKATESIRLVNNAIPFSMETKHLKYYENSQLPVIILLWRKSENSFYHLFAQRFIREELSAKDPQWQTKKTKTISFSACSKLTDVSLLRTLATEGYLYTIQQQLNINLQAGSATYWLDGIPRSDDEELKEGVLKALSLLVNKKYRDGIVEFERVLRVCTVSPKQKMAILLSLGNAYYSLGQLNQARKNFDAVVDLSKKVDEKEALIGKVVAIGNTGLIHGIRGDSQKAFKCHKLALKLSRKMGDKDGQAIALSNLALNFRISGDLDAALKYQEKALKLEKETGRKSGQAASLCNVGVIYEEKGEIEDALEYFVEALKLSQEIGLRKGEAVALGNIGLIHASKGETDTALAYYEKALEITREIGDMEGEADNLSNMGLIRGDLYSDESLEDFARSLKIERKIGDKKGEAIALGNIGLVYLQRWNLDKALSNFIRALKIDKKIGYKQGEATDLSDIGMVHKAKGNLDGALKYLGEALKIDRAISHKKGEIDDLYTIGLIYLEKGDSLSALKNLIEALSITDHCKIAAGREAIQDALNSIIQKIPQQQFDRTDDQI